MCFCCVYTCHHVCDSALYWVLRVSSLPCCGFQKSNSDLVEKPLKRSFFVLFCSETKSYHITLTCNSPYRADLALNLWSFASTCTRFTSKHDHVHVFYAADEDLPPPPKGWDLGSWQQSSSAHLFLVLFHSAGLTVQHDNLSGWIKPENWLNQKRESQTISNSYIFTW